VQGWEKGAQDPCACHETQTDITNTWNEQPQVAETARKGRGQVGFLHSSTIGRHDFLGCCASISLEESLPPQDVATRWRSEWGLSDGMRKQQDAVLIYDVRFSGGGGSAKAKSFQENKFTPVDWQVNNQGSAQLFGLSHASQILEGSTYPTSNLVMYLMYNNMGAMQPDAPIRQHWNGELIALADIHPAILEARASLLDDMDFRWRSGIDSERERFYLICTLMDPRLKAMSFWGVDDDLRARALQCLTTEYDANWAPAAAPTRAPQAPPSADAFTHYDIRSFSGFMQHVQHIQPVASAPVSQEAAELAHEVTAYMAADVEPMTTEVLYWWSKVGHNKYPHLAKLARQYLGCPASSAAAERVFSLAGRVFGDHNQNLTPQNLEERMWAKCNRNKLDCMNSN
jgi:hypothetical protein